MNGNDIKGQLEEFGIANPGDVVYNGTRTRLTEEAIKLGEGYLVKGGALLAFTGQHTGRSPNDKFIVEESQSKDQVWWGTVNRPFEQERFNQLLAKAKEYLSGKDLFVADCFVGADARYRVGVRVINEHAWHNLFAQTMFIPLNEAPDPSSFQVDYTVVHVPDMSAIPEEDGTRSGTFVLVDFGQKIILIGGTSYAGEIKKSLFTTMNYLLPLQGVMPMHCSANIGEAGDTALFFGLSGTGKTTLSADPERSLIGDDEHGWSNDGVFNFEGGCYAKVIRLSEEAEPQIYETTRMFSTILENVDFDKETRELDLDSAKFTENTRAAYPLDFIPNTVPDSTGGHPRTIIMLTADAFGVLPPIAKLTPAQAMYQFISGYTAKVAGTEKGVTEPQPTFSACFGAPFMVHHPSVYAELLGAKIREHNASCWLINTGWTGGAYGTGSRMKIAYTRAMVKAALSGALDNAEFQEDPIFGLNIPTHVEGVPDEVLNPRNTWSNPEEYDEKANILAAKFNENFKTYEEGAAQEIRDAGPKVKEAASA
ncbi:MAG: phosphoenolpyruvate carboxykinase (ATP) [Ignavibacteriae bacterium]|nr:phosphoenolpyruvate carboxykinase (ATP) [Ignavibacteriota bacterium]MCB9217005.1 phosphoenolpyruvate carboxykinase (ATP) [Ignavibacteria bacterium]